jgi:hypothetical protein
VTIPDLTEESFYYLIDSNYTIKKACKILSEYFYIFFKENLQTADIEFLYYKIINTNIEKFMKSKPTLIREDILQYLLIEYRYQIKVFLSKNTEKLLSY